MAVLSPRLAGMNVEPRNMYIQTIHTSAWQMLFFTTIILVYGSLLVWDNKIYYIIVVEFFEAAHHLSRV